uniref:Uncharacterized protein n=1 Tax=Anguilla anguilla TaxID=7936 RepID=A0A0E9Q1S0_ANGAN
MVGIKLYNKLHCSRVEWCFCFFVFLNPHTSTLKALKDTLTYL